MTNIEDWIKSTTEKMENRIANGSRQPLPEEAVLKEILRLRMEVDRLEEEFAGASHND